MYDYFNLFNIIIVFFIIIIIRIYLFIFDYKNYHIIIVIGNYHDWLCVISPLGYSSAALFDPTYSLHVAVECHRATQQDNDGDT